MKKLLPSVFLLLMVLASVLALCLTHWSYSAQDREAILAPASAAHPAGTDALGRDRLVRTAAALLIGLSGATAAATISIFFAAGFGLLAGFSPHWVAAVLMFVSDGFLSLPWLFLLMTVRSLLPLTASPLVTAVITFAVLAVLGWPAFARVIYRGAQGMRSSEWMLQGRACGLTTGQLMRVHVVPQLRPLMMPQFLVCVPAFVMAEANLGALGLGVGEPIPSWGAMLMELDNSALLVSSHWVYLPIALLVIVLLLLECFASEEKAYA